MLSFKGKILNGIAKFGSAYNLHAWLSPLKLDSHRPTRRDKTVAFRRVCVGGVNQGLFTAHQLNYTQPNSSENSRIKMRVFRTNRALTVQSIRCTPCSKKGYTKLMAVTLLILSRFLKFFTVRFSSKFSAKYLLKMPPHLIMRRYTTLWNINVRKWATVAR